jgi:hypothetical protein
MTDIRSALGAARLEGEQRRHRHRWVYTMSAAICPGCNTVEDIEAHRLKSRRGRTARQRGNRRELELAKQLGGVKVGQYGGPDDVRVGDMFAIQSKVRGNFPTWMTTELDKLPRTGGRIPVLIVTGPAGLDPADRRKRPAIAIVHLTDWTDLHGREP